ncbi:MAG: lipopolysaccharide biosynthesis protein [Candidatus Delongbacteria bacterium]|jgi:teichuronic acid exporter|nr:lipopolysaccharide biosynthesis protein [Candidatus Delongbacteria bacterium]
MANSLTNKTISGVFWSGTQRFASLGIQFIITLIIARILTPEDYGLIGMVTIFTALGIIILDSGFGQALIRKQDTTDEDYSTILFFQILLGVLTYTVLFFASPLIAAFYNTPQLESLSKVIFLILPINSLGMIHLTILRKNVRFKTYAKITIISAIVSGSIAVTMAYLGFGVWTLVVQMLLQALFVSILLWHFIKWRPKLVFKIESIKSIILFSSSLLSIGIIKTIARNIYTLLIGKFYPIAQVGYYNQAKRFEEIPSQSITGIIQSVSYPVLSTLQSDDKKLKQGYKKVITQTMFIILPLMIVLAAIADNLFLVLLTDKWSPSVPLFRILCAFGILYPLHSINENILKVKGRGKLLVILEILKNIILFITILLTIRAGVVILLLGSVLTSFISVLINMYFCGKEINYKILEQFRDISPIGIISLISAAIVWSLNLLNFSSLITLILQIPLSIIMFITFCELFNISAYYTMKNILISKLKK